MLGPIRPHGRSAASTGAGAQQSVTTQRTADLISDHPVLNRGKIPFSRSIAPFVSESGSVGEDEIVIVGEIVLGNLAA